MATEAEIKAAAEAISRSFHEEGYIEGQSDTSEWQEFLNAARAALEAAERVREKNRNP